MKAAVRKGTMRGRRRNKLLSRDIRRNEKRGVDPGVMGKGIHGNAIDRFNNKNRLKNGFQKIGDAKWSNVSSLNYFNNAGKRIATCNHNIQDDSSTPNIEGWAIIFGTHDYFRSSKFRSTTECRIETVRVEFSR